MLRSLEIRNYRNLRHLTIEKLGRVNLLVGKNNTGKTSVLEAVYLYLRNFDFSVLYEFNIYREETTSEDNKALYIINALPNLFYSRKLVFPPNKAIIIKTDEKELSISIVQCQENEDHTLKEVNEDSENPQFCVKFINGEKTELKKFPPTTLADIFRNLSSSKRQEYVQLVRANAFESSISIKLWNNVLLTDKEEEILKALRIVEPSIQRVSYQIVNEVESKIKAVVKLSTYDHPVSLRSMGDGINRILTIILAMVNCEKGYLLIDEFENGLHYSVQEKLWEIVFYLAERLNIQVFATTHSNDTIKAFGEVATSKPDYNDAQLIQLRNIKGEISAVLFNAQDVEIATETDYLDLR